MKNVLHWDPPEGLTGVEVLYTVQYFIYGQKKWLDKPECRKSNRTYCDLSAETSDYEHQYYARVKASRKATCSKWTETGRFYPYLETQIGPPAVALTAGEKSISVVLTASEKWRRTLEEGAVSMQQVYPALVYNVSMYSPQSHRMWWQCVANGSLVVPWLEPDTLYCVRVEALVPGPPRLPLPSEKQCISTLKDQTQEWKIKIIFCYVLPISVTVFLFSVMCYAVYRYVHVGKEKRPGNLIVIYGNEFEKRFFAPAEKIVMNLISISVLDGATGNQKDICLTETSGGLSDLLDTEAREAQEAQQEEEEEVKHLGYASHLMEMLCGSEENMDAPSLTQPAALCRARATTTAVGTVVEYEYDVRMADISLAPEDQELKMQEEVCIEGIFLEQQARLADRDPQTWFCSSAPELGDVDPGTIKLTEAQEGLEEEPARTVVDWDPQTGRLCIPSLSDLEPDSEGDESPEGRGLRAEGLLSRFCKEQAADKLLEDHETYLVQFLEDWELFVQMGD
ncbi:interleukin-20 receptor subunit alpha [Echinops telfairi]|uniref:Interleukin-20 receptor subunit alpha n=1 Tax=Echinops telfairi TaxID=9371 RepID=A0ABM0IKN4_ECHTE|nr:interleukin-20 receptor subunit alpha [Echinops telfairi]